MIKCPICGLGKLVLSRDALITYEIRTNKETNEYYLVKNDLNLFDTSEVWCDKCLVSDKFDKRLEKVYNEIN